MTTETNYVYYVVLKSNLDLKLETRIQKLYYLNK